MKALSLRQPRAEQVVRGHRTMDIRTWSASYRGPLAIHAGVQRRPERIRELGFDPEGLAYGAIVGVVELVNVLPLDAVAYEAARREHLSNAPYPQGPCFGWRFQRPARIDPALPTRGRQRLFEIGDDLGAVLRLGVGAAPEEIVPDPARPFVLYALPEPGGAYRIALFQWPLRETRNEPGKRPTLATALAPGALWQIEIGGDSLRAVIDQVMGALRANGHRPSDLARSLRQPFFLGEATGLRLALVLLAVRPLQRLDRIERIRNGLQDMSDEEAYYWFSKCTAGPDASSAQQALRVLLAGS